jgi:hypothetical protein
MSGNQGTTRTVISFDIGIKNLAYCILRENTIAVWKVADISMGKSKPTFEDLCTNLICVLDSLVEHVRDSDHVTVFIENQPAFKAPTMKSIQIFIFAYFKILKTPFYPKLISASTKNVFMKKHGYELKAKDYKSNKQSSIQCVTEYLTSKDMTRELEILQQSSKKDDLCDCLLQAMACCDII